ncbi:DUF1707 SHOCT-like domain-containing protein [Nocardioides hwasunensis]|uniref:DUF1707 and DUF2154 domain-containing protein n=1 Tax=Nocardioides hwasunensis TaxID=397258 RepID=A0ABR8MGB2_9ACTN|nr:DUF1707 domain-containing protein [Nocardioides hwasunensis]MBD3915114.1 DUF1707 and DUF2154 domain-containing protein [Nocardioides hwasunensis]
MGEIENRPHDPSQMRISDADRQRVADVLRDAAGEGRIDLDELEERLELTWQAKTYGELVPITLDLQATGPVAPPAASPVRRPHPHVPAVGHASSTAIMGETKRQGLWSVPEHHSAFALMGSVVIDLRQAQLESQHTQINASSIMGEVKIIVPAHVHVVVDGTPIMGEFTQQKDKVEADLGPDSPVVRVRGMALMGSVNVQRQPAPGTPKKFLGSY